MNTVKFMTIACLGYAFGLLGTGHATSTPVFVGTEVQVTGSNGSHVALSGTTATYSKITFPCVSPDGMWYVYNGVLNKVRGSALLSSSNAAGIFMGDYNTGWVGPVVRQGDAAQEKTTHLKFHPAAVGSQPVEKSAL